MKRTLATIYALFCTLLMVAGFCAVFYFAWEKGTPQIIACLCGLVLGFVLAPTVHELGHLCFAKAVGMECVYSKFFCLKISLKEGKKRLSLASPFAPDQTQVLPKKGGKMAKRAVYYTMGGLLTSGAFAVLLLAVAIHFHLFVVWGALPYVVYLYFLNLPPLTYGSGKTDTLVFLGIKKGYDSERCMLSAMEIQGQLFEGKAFAEIDEKYYFDLPQLPEDDPVFSMLLDLRYRYYLDKGDYDRAGEALNRLASLEGYLPAQEIERLAAELTYMHAVRGDMERASDCGRLCKEYLAEESLSALRILSAYAAAGDRTEEAKILKEKAEEKLSAERILGVRKLEKALLDRINA